MNLKRAFCNLNATGRGQLLQGNSPGVRGYGESHTDPNLSNPGVARLDWVQEVPVQLDK